MTWMYGWFLQIIHSAPRRHALMEPVMTTLNTAMGCPTAEMAPMNSTAVSRREQNLFLILSILSIYASKIFPLNSQCQRVKKRSIYLIKNNFHLLATTFVFWLFSNTTLPASPVWVRQWLLCPSFPCVRPLGRLWRQQRRARLWWGYKCWFWWRVLGCCCLVVFFYHSQCEAIPYH